MRKLDFPNIAAFVQLFLCPVKRPAVLAFDISDFIVLIALKVGIANYVIALNRFCPTVSERGIFFDNQALDPTLKMMADRKEILRTRLGE